MLQIQHIKKDYKTGDLVQHALNDVSVNLRENEFVAILGPSGSGKTTLLNVIGGLDRYDSGDLIINGTSTKKYRDRDWDSYRNHTIGFVFQSYNLIMHQTVLANVELALTISGISGAKRREKAKAALEKVGLADHMYKKPGQMSGGQMQRVAIARALVNDPDIVLADEPTGALDSETSVQVMDLLQEVAKDRLVVMVTHNPELARQYATRIVTIKDGNILSDTDPFEPDESKMAPAVHRNLGRSSMSFLTALSLSFNNLRTKKARTVLVSFAGSIGIIGIALILSLSTGVNQYIKYQESETLSEYPLQLQKTGFDLTSLMAGGSSGSFMSSGSSVSDTTEGKVNVAEVITEMFGGVSTNNLKALKTYLDSGESGIEEHVRSIEYRYQITPQIYLDDGDEILQVNPGSLFEGISVGDSSLSAMLSMSSGADFFYELPQNEQLYKDGYVLDAGRWPQNENELVLVLGNGGRISDLVLYGIGMKDRSEIENKLRGADGAVLSASIEEKQSEWNPAGEAVTESAVESTTETLTDAGIETTAESVTDTALEMSTENLTDAGTEASTGSAVTEQESTSSGDSIYELYDYEDFLGKTFKLVYNSDFFVYDEEYEVWTDKSGNSAFVSQLVKEGQELVITGIVEPKEDASAAMLSAGIGYTHGLMDQIMETSEMSEVVQAQLSDPETNIFTGQPFGEERDASDINLGELFTIDEDAFAEAFGTADGELDLSALAANLSGADLDLSGLDLSGLDLSGLSLSGSSNPLSMNLSGDDLSGILEMLDLDAIAGAFPAYSDELADELLDAALVDMTSEERETLLRQMAEEILQGYTAYIASDQTADITQLGAGLQSWLKTEEAAAVLRTWFDDVVSSNSSLLFTEDELLSAVQSAAGGFASSLLMSGDALPDLSQINGLSDLMPLITEYWAEFEQYLASSPELIGFRNDVLGRLTGITVTEDQQTALFTGIVNGYAEWAEKNHAPQVDKIQEQFVAYLQSDNVMQIMAAYAEKFIDTETLTNTVTDLLTESLDAVGNELSTQISGMTAQIMSSLTAGITSALTGSMQSLAGSLSSAVTAGMSSMLGGMGDSLTEGLSDSLTDMFSINPDVLADAVSFNMSVDEIGELLTSLLTEGGASLSDNLAALGYADEADPYEIDIYPTDFEAKNAVTKVLDTYNQMCTEENREDETITYTDYVAAMMSSVTRIVDTISYVLIAFVAISLVVSSIMIGVITYISVLERRKEIGVLRAIGASKNNVSQVFNAETFITGLLAGSIGIGVTLLLTIPINMVIDHYISQEGLRAQLPPGAAGILIILSVILTMIAGLIPSGKAAKSDPVAALRSD